jgi:hypothetical protein
MTRALSPVKLLLAVFLIAAILSVVGAVKTSAMPLSAASFEHVAAAACPKPKLLGVFVPWYQYLKVGKDSTGSCGIKSFNLLPGGGQSSDVPLILLAIVDDMVRLAGLVAVIFVIMGGVQYATSQGNPDATAKAQSTIINALIGLAIAIIAVAFVTFLGNALT